MIDKNVRKRWRMVIIQLRNANECLNTIENEGWEVHTIERSSTEEALVFCYRFIDGDEPLEENVFVI